MTDRDMSYELDGIFNTRNAGELVTVQQTRTRVRRSPGLAPAARMEGGDVRNLTPAIGRSMSIGMGRKIGAGNPRNLSIGMGRNLGNPMFRRPRDLADDMGAITLPIIGTVGVMSLLLAAVGGFAAYKFLK